jgi:hypothetical protein
LMTVRDRKVISRIITDKFHIPMLRMCILSNPSISCSYDVDTAFVGTHNDITLCCLESYHRLKHGTYFRIKKYALRYPLHTFRLCTPSNSVCSTFCNTLELMLERASLM